MNIPETAKAVINSGRLAHLVTINADGSPQVTIVWFAPMVMRS
jgi:Pyridoxamine 5'-phosphate oxidase